MKQKKLEKPDYWLVMITFLLLGFGLVMVFSASYYKGLLNYNDSYYFIKKQLIAAGIGLVIFFIVSNIRYTIYQKLVIPFTILSILLLIAVLIVGTTANGAKRWIQIGSIPFQPSEFVKLAMIFYTASIMIKKQSVIHNFKRALIPPLTVIGIICSLLYFQPHFSAIVIILCTTLVIIFCAGAQIRHLLFLFVASTPVLLIILYTSDYRMERITTMLNPFNDPTGSGYQTIFSLYAIGPGGLTGLGLGNSIQKMAYLPEAHNDFIFSIIAEELGFFGGAFVIFLFIVLIVRGIRIAMQSPDQFGTLLGIGIITLIGVETIFNLGVVTALLPVTGVSLPLISYGGTSLVFKMMAMGILLNISRYRQVKKQKRPLKVTSNQSISHI